MIKAKCLEDVSQQRKFPRNAVPLREQCLFPLFIKIIGPVQFKCCIELATAYSE